MKCFLTVNKKPLQSKVLLAMKLTTLLTFFFTLNVAANGFGQEKISLKVKKTEISGVLRFIEKQTTYRFLYNDKLEDIRERVSLNLKEVDINEALDQLLEKTRLLYQVMDNNLIVIKEDPNAPPRLPDVVVRGKVTGEGGLPLAGASVQVKGTTNGTTTNNDGAFVLTVANANVTLVVSTVGYDQQEIALGGRTDITVALNISIKVQDAVVVIGYGTASKRDLTGSIVKISGKDVADKPNTNPIASLQGKVAGLSVVNSGTPGQAPDIRIRGTVSIGQVHPLYVVDGIFNDNIDYINPNDIESIEVLKDPSSLAIFGVKGATGVIAITTKRAKAGQVVVNFNTSYGFKKLVDKIKVVDAAGFKMLFDEENANNGVTTPDYSALTANTDWVDAVIRTGHFNNNNISVSGSTEKNRFNLGLGYLTDEGIIKHEKLERMLLSFSDELKLNKAIKIGINLNSTRQHNPYDAGWVLDAARKVMPQVSAGTKRFRIQNPYGTDSLDADLYSGLAVALQSAGVINPLLQIENTWDKNITIEYRNVGSIYADINFLKYFNFRSTFYADMSTYNRREYTPLYAAYDPISNTPLLYSNLTQFHEDVDNYRKFQQDYILTFRKTFGDHSVTATAGLTTYYFGAFRRHTIVKQGTDATALPIPDDERFWYVSSGPWGVVDPANTNSSQNEYATASVLGRLLYNYKNKYYLNASIRDDGSSQIPSQNRHQKFWAVGAAWELTKETFMQNIRLIDFLKLKASIGTLGNQSASYLDGTPINYPFYPNLNTGVNAVFGPYIYSAADQSYIPNPDLKWETVNAREVGIELNAFKNKLHFEANYFNKTTNDLMTYVSRGSLGLKDELINGGSLKNWGEEFSATWNQNFSRDLSVSIGGNITFLKNKVLSLADDLPTGYLARLFQNNGSAESRTTVGYPIGAFWGYVVEGLYQSYADVLASPVASALGAYGPGDFKFKDINGPDGKGPDGKITVDDRMMIGNPTPKFTYGASLSATYKGLTLSVDMLGVYGNQVFRTWGSLESPFQRVNYSADKLERWHGSGTSNWVPIISQGHRFNYVGSTYNIEDGSFFRLRNIQLGYDFAKTLISKFKINNLRVFANVQNLKTWKNNFGYTAEFGGDATAFGYDNAGGALPMVTTFGLNVTF
jgi:TonB-linked SusC/RagA family outer membrane protein